MDVCDNELSSYLIVSQGHHVFKPCDKLAICPGCPLPMTQNADADSSDPKEDQLFGEWMDESC